MGLFWRFFWFYEALISGGIILAAVPSWLVHGIPHHSESVWTELLFGIAVMTVACALFAARCTLQLEKGDKEKPGP